MDVSILIVDDDAAVRWILNRKLNDLGYRADTAVNGKEAVQLATSKRYGLIFMDLRMPLMDGFQATVAIREFESAKGLSPIPIVALSAHPDPVKCRQAGMNDYYEKPMLDEHFRDIFAKWLDPEWQIAPSATREKR